MSVSSQRECARFSEVKSVTTWFAAFQYTLRTDDTILSLSLARQFQRRGESGHTTFPDTYKVAWG